VLESGKKRNQIASGARRRKKKKGISLGKITRTGWGEGKKRRDHGTAKLPDQVQTERKSKGEGDEKERIQQTHTGKNGYYTHVARGEGFVPTKEAQKQRRKRPHSEREERSSVSGIATRTTMGVTADQKTGLVYRRYKRIPVAAGN